MSATSERSGPLTGGLLRRWIEPVISERLQEEPVIVLTGPRTAGKSTVLDAVAESYDVGITDLDVLQSRAMVADDPELFVTSAKEPICIDEFQHVLPVLDAIKAELNRDLRPGRFLLTGSSRYSMLPAASQSLAGRVHVMTLLPLSQGEIRGHRERFLEAFLTEPESLVAAEPSTTTRTDYESMVLAGGFPLALARPTRSGRDRWFEDFVTTVLERDVLELRKVRQRDVLPRILRHLAARTGGILNASEIANRVGLDRVTTGDFVGLLESVFLVHRLPGFGRTLSSRTTATPKVHLVDSGLASYLMALDPARLQAREPTALTEFGHVLETFVVNEVLKQATWSDADMTFSHFRTKDKQEVDLVIENRRGQVAAIEVKAGSLPAEHDFSGLRRLRTLCGDDFIAGAVVHLGQHSYRHDDRLYALPLDSLWTAPRAARSG